MFAKGAPGVAEGANVIKKTLPDQKQETTEPIEPDLHTKQDPGRESNKKKKPF